MKIVEIVRDARNLALPIVFRVGSPIIEGGHTVSEILYCRDGYSSGTKGRRPSYVVKFIDTPEVRVFPETEIIDMAILPDEPGKGKKDTTTIAEASIELPA
jgi:hypothetical protein